VPTEALRPSHRKEVKMPIAVHSSEDALKIAFDNRAYRTWPSRREKNRVEPVAFPRFAPSFELEPREKIFTIGSCFARNIETHLDKLNFDVVALRLMDDPIVQNEPVKNHILNKYVPHSILNELTWALDDDVTPYPDPDGFLEDGTDQWQDANMHSVEPGPLDYVRKRRQLVLENTRQIRDCRVVILTLGLVEAWWDKRVRGYINQAPPIRYLRKEPERFSLHVMTYPEVLNCLNDIHALLRKHLVENFRVVLTVSPVPLNGTFRDLDVMVANTYSKSVLRAAAEEFHTTHDNVDYFPSFESVLISQRNVAWDDDLIHPTDAIVGANVRRMIKGYYSAFEGIDETKAIQEDGILSQFQKIAAELAEKDRALSDAQEKLTKLEHEFRLLENDRNVQEEVIRAKDVSIKRAQDTATNYLRQILERDGILDKSSA
jgi:GSCFA family